MNDAPGTPTTTPDALMERRNAVLVRMENAIPGVGRPARPQLLAVSKTRDARQIRALAGAGQRAFGENYVQEALDKQQALTDLDLEWHLIGPLQSNKAKLAATHFHWVQSIDRPKLVQALARHRPDALGPLNVLIQVNIDDEASKSGCTPADIAPLAAMIVAEQRLRLRGLMAIPAPRTGPEASRPAFARLRTLFDELRREHPGVDTLSMGMSADFEQAIAEGATLVRVGSALFGPRGGQA